MANLIRTTEHNLAIGEPVFLEDGSPGLRIKGNGQVYDVISIRSIEYLTVSALKRNVPKYRTTL